MTSLPKMVRIRQRFDSNSIDDVGATVRQRLEASGILSRLKPKARVAVAAGSRGITGIAEVTRAVCQALVRAGAQPFIVPAMGSHGGATPEGQTSLLAHYGISAEAMEAPVNASMESVLLGSTPEGIAVHFSREALNADAIIAINRVKPHTDYRGQNESGIVKMLSVGFGKREGASEYHSQAAIHGYDTVFRAGVQMVLGTGKVLCGVGLVENAYHQTAYIEILAPETLITQDAALLVKARRLMPRLPIDPIDVLIVDRMGKNISGTGMDPNITGRGVHGYILGQPVFSDAPAIHRIIVRDLTDETEGNALGVGMADFTTRRLAEKIDWKKSTINALTARTPANMKLPVVCPSDSEALEMAISSLPSRPNGLAVARIGSTLDLVDLEVSESVAQLLGARGDIEVVSSAEPMRFDGDGNLV
ncbi:MAG: lactate racemase domain-containing protein [Acidobacteriota bacterium]